MDTRTLFLAGAAILAFYFGPSIVVVIAVLRNRRRKRRILDSGIPGSAVIDRMTSIGTTTLHGRIHKTELTIEPQDGAPYPLKMKRALAGDQYALYWPGARLPIRIDPSNPRRIEFVEDQQKAQDFYGPGVRVIRIES